MKPTGMICFLCTVVIVGAMFVGCLSSDGTSTPEPTPIQTEPDFIGDIVEVHAIGDNGILGTLLVEGEDVIQSSDKYVVTIDTETVILQLDGETVSHLSFAEFDPGQPVRIWFSGPVRESYPAQVNAAQVMVVNRQDDHGTNLGDEFTMTLGERVQFSDVSLELIFEDVVDDSRCPANAQCIWAGEVIVDIRIVAGNGIHSMRLTQPGLSYDYSTDSFADYEIAFKVLPYPDTQGPIADEEYRLVLKVTEAGHEVTGTLEGHVTIGPIQPVVQPGDDPDDVPPQAYDARKILVYDTSGKELIEQVDIGHDGHYDVELAFGTYLIDINHLGVDRSGDVPATIEIKRGEATILDIDIDTGIR